MKVQFVCTVWPFWLLVPILLLFSAYKRVCIRIKLKIHFKTMLCVSKQLLKNLFFFCKLWVVHVYMCVATAGGRRMNEANSAQPKIQNQEENFISEMKNNKNKNWNCWIFSAHSQVELNFVIQYSVDIPYSRIIRCLVPCFQ